jgi:hypothetical protein
MSTSQNALFKATPFERDHSLFIHCVIVGTAFLTYFLDREDIVWRFIKNHGAETRALEHTLFLLATFFVGIGGYLCTIARKGAVQSSPGTPRSRPPRLLHYSGQFLYAVGLASLLPVAGYVILIAGEGVRLLRLWLADVDSSITHSARQTSRQRSLEPNAKSLAEAVRRETLKWCVLVTMVVFTITLRDRYADVLICASIFLALVANWRLVRSYVQDAAA